MSWALKVQHTDQVLYRLILLNGFHGGGIERLEGRHRAFWTHVELLIQFWAMTSTQGVAFTASAGLYSAVYVASTIKKWRMAGVPEQVHTIGVPQRNVPL